MSEIRDFTRGGQTFLHNFRMVTQIIGRVLLFSLFCFVATGLVLVYMLTTAYQRSILSNWLWAKVLIVLNKDAKQQVMMLDGSSVSALPAQILNDAFIQHAVQAMAKTGMIVFIGAFVVSALASILVSLWLRKRGQDQSATKKLRGDELADFAIVKKMIVDTKQVSDFSIEDLPLPANFETKHVFIHGTIGSGKSVLIKRFLDQIRERGDRAIVYDKGCDFVRSYYRPNQDLILNPLDERTVSWHLWNDCRDFADYESMAAALMPLTSHGSDPFWINAARTIFSAAARQMAKEKDRSVLSLLSKLLTSDLAVTENYLRGTEAETLVSGKAEKTAISIKSVLATYLKALK